MQGKIHVGRKYKHQQTLKLEAQTSDNIIIQVWDKDFVKNDDLVGETIFPVCKLLGGEFKDNLELKYKGKTAGLL